MSDEDFLSRWSRRKHAAAVEAKRAQDESAAPVPDDQPKPQAEEAGAAFDLSTLPPVDSITAISDVRNFLRAGVPAELTRAALRRAWATDPAIRDFIGLAENAWDFTKPDTIPGFGPLDASPEEIRALVDRIVNGAREVSQTVAPQEAPQKPTPTAPQPQVSADEKPVPVAGRPFDADAIDDPAPKSPVDIAMQYPPTEQTKDKPRPRRPHGKALPH